jgi:hypothetical protein
MDLLYHKKHVMSRSFFEIVYASKDPASKKAPAADRVPTPLMAQRNQIHWGKPNTEKGLVKKDRVPIERNIKKYPPPKQGMQARCKGFRPRVSHSAGLAPIDQPMISQNVAGSPVCSAEYTTRPFTTVT